MRNLFILLIGILLTISCAEKKTQPNIILIVTDDQGWGDVGFHGNHIVQTPRLDAFAASSLELTNFHVGTTCTPTRAGIMTARNANRNGAWHTVAGASILNDDELTMPEVLKTAGYKTGMFGKWHLGDSYPYRPFDRGFDESFYHGGGGVQQTPDLWNNDYFSDTYFRNGKPEETSGFCTDVWFDELLKFIDNSEEKPFFAYLATNAAHSPFNAPEKYHNIYKDADLKARQINFYGMLTNLDDNFGRLEDYLKERGLFENTILIYTTDNGTAGGASFDKKENKTYGFNPLRGHKGSHYDGGHRVPFLMSWPEGGFGEAKKIDELVAHVDLLPTLAAFAGADFQPIKPIDGSDISNQLKGKSEFSERMLITDTQRGQWPEQYKNPCVMQGPWRLVNHKELYNTETDLGQKNDLALDYPDRVKAMQEFYDSWWEEIRPEWKHSPTYIGAEENPVMITIHDLHPYNEKDGRIAWNQDLIRKGDIDTKGYYKIKVAQSGTYKFSLSRWPKESGLAFDQAVPEVPKTLERESLSFGKSILMKSALIKIGESEVSTEVDNELSQAMIEVKLQEGNYQLEAWFDTMDNTYFPAYFIETEFVE